jgi:hypothetical protein
MGPIDRAIASRQSSDSLQKAQGALQFAPSDLQNTLGPVFSEALKRQSKRGY